jgi:hypothetical protein
MLHSTHPKSDQPPSPALSVLLATEGSEQSIRSLRLVLRMLAEQTIAAQIEVVVVVLAGAGARQNDFDDNAVIESLHAVKVLRIPFRRWGQAMSAAVREASADVVVLAEDHAFAPPNWAAALVAAHASRPRDAGIGPAMGNANPRSALSWSHLLIDYGLWLDPSPGGTMPDIPGHNASYKRAALLDFERDALALALDHGGALHHKLQSWGHGLSIEPLARCFHLNPSKWSDSVSMRFHAGRIFGASRSAGWSALARVAYVIGAPLLPVMRLRYRLANLRRARRTREALCPMHAVTLLLMTLVGVLGEVCGYALGAGTSPLVMLDFEFGRYRQMRAADFRDGIRIGDVVLPLRLPRESIREVEQKENVAAA